MKKTGANKESWARSANWLIRTKEVPKSQIFNQNIDEIKSIKLKKAQKYNKKRKF